MKKIPFNKPCYTGNEEKYILQAIKNSKLAGDNFFGKKCEDWFEKFLGCRRALLTPSCTHALEMIAILLDIKEGDEVIMPSFTFVSTANAFVLRGARIKFVDIRPDTMNIDEAKIEQAITEKTRAIVVVHYAGVACNMEKVMEIASKYNLYVVEDAAQCINSFYKNKPLGTIGHLGAYSFHETKNITSGGEGGLLIINDEKFIERAEIIREKGTNRKKFLRGEIDKYTWVDIGSSYLMNEISAAYLWGQLEKVKEITNYRLLLWNTYYSKLTLLEKKGFIKLPKIPKYAKHNAHIFYIKTRTMEEREILRVFLLKNGIHATFHYIPLHTSPAGKKYGYFVGEDIFTTSESSKLLRLPLYFNMSLSDVEYVVNKIFEFYLKNRI